MSTPIVSCGSIEEASAALHQAYDGTPFFDLMDAAAEITEADEEEIRKDRAGQWQQSRRII